MSDFITSFLFMLEEMAPFLLLGFLIAGVLHAFVPGRLYGKLLSGNGPRSVLLSMAVGIPLPLCSCGVIPTAVSMRRQGASKPATNAFLISTPQTGVDSIAATWSVLGLPFAILRPVVALLTGLSGGLLTGLVDKEETSVKEALTGEDDLEGRSFAGRTVEALRYGYLEMMEDIGLWLFIGLVVAAAISVLVPDSFFMSYAHSHLLNMFLILLVAAPMYVCATGSIPVAAALMMKGLSPGAALVFLMAGPATNVASILVLGKTLGKKSLAVYLASIIVGAIGFGMIVDFLLPAEWFALPAKIAGGACCHAAEMTSVPWWQTVSSVVLLLLLVRALLFRLGVLRHPEAPAFVGETSSVTEYSVKGMACSHCVANVQSHLEALEGVRSVSVDLASGIAAVDGDVPPEKVVETVRSLGYGCEIVR